MCNYNNNAKRPNKRSILKAAEHLMAIYGSTTTLEVKKYLRGKGYTIFQYQVSLAMDKLCETQNWEYDFNGKFRTFFMKQNPVMMPTVYTLVPSFSLN